MPQIVQILFKRSRSQNKLSSKTTSFFKGVIEAFVHIILQDNKSSCVRNIVEDMLGYANREKEIPVEMISCQWSYFTPELSCVRLLK